MLKSYYKEPGKITPRSQTETYVTAQFVPSESLTAEQYAELEGKLLDNADVFALDGSELGYTDIVKHSIDTGDHSPIKQNPRRTPFVHRNKISQLVNDMLKQQVIQPSTIKCMGESGCFGAKERWDIKILCRLPKDKCCDEERCVSAPQS